MLLCLHCQIQVREEVRVLPRVCKGLCCLGIDLGKLLAPQLDNLQFHLIQVGTLAYDLVHHELPDYVLY